MKKKLVLNILFFITISLTQAFSQQRSNELAPPLINQFIQGKIREGEIESQRKFILTGGPGVGKTSIIRCLHQLGYLTVDEAATSVIQESFAQGISEPWLKSDFEDRVIDLQKKNYLQAVSSPVGSIFFDRGPVDPITYALMLQKLPSQKLISFVQDSIDHQLYDHTVFLIENLGFCHQNAQRVESNEQSLEIEQALEANYRALGFKIIRIPPFTHLEEKEAIFKRTQLILEFCGVILDPNTTSKK